MVSPCRITATTSQFHPSTARRSSARVVPDEGRIRIDVRSEKDELAVCELHKVGDRSAFDEGEEVASRGFSRVDDEVNAKLFDLGLELGVFNTSDGPRYPDIRGSAACQDVDGIRRADGDEEIGVVETGLHEG